jgi:hypothetical protein
MRIFVGQNEAELHDKDEMANFRRSRGGRELHSHESRILTHYSAGEPQHFVKHWLRHDYEGPLVALKRMGCRHIVVDRDELKVKPRQGNTARRIFSNI